MRRGWIHTVGLCICMEMQNYVAEQYQISIRMYIYGWVHLRVKKPTEEEYLQSQSPFWTITELE